MPRTLVIVRKDDVFFKKFVEEPDLFGNSDESLNSFKENQILFEIENNKSRSENFHSPNGESADSSNDSKATESSQTGQVLSDGIENSDEIKRNNGILLKEPFDFTREHYTRTLENDNCVLEQLLDDLELLKSVRSRTGFLNYGAKQLELMKQKLLVFLCKQRGGQLNEAIFTNGSGQLFRDNAECLKFIQYVLDNEPDLKIDDDSRLNADLNLYLRLKLKNELILGKLLRGLNIRHDSRPTVERCVEQFRAKLEPKSLSILLDLQRKFAVIDRQMKITLNEYNELLGRYYELLEEKEVLRLRYFTNEMRLVERFRTEIKQLHSSNLSATNKINIAERGLKRLQNKM